MWRGCDFLSSWVEGDCRGHSFAARLLGRQELSAFIFSPLRCRFGRAFWVCLVSALERLWGRHSLCVWHPSV
uniref:Uncharacterized protein n=1 Tax=Encephalitozoon cuniculi TaxID=6035 RepID=M1KMT3_ENCCN|nr:hypothetical protein ECU01_0005 [Encephalitozoon cuniculi]